MKRFAVYLGRYGTGLSIVDVTNETDKTVVIASYEELLGFSHYGKRTSRDNVRLFDDAADAVSCLIDLEEKRIEKLEQAVASCREFIGQAKELLAELQK